MSDQIEREQQIEEESLTKNSLQIQKAAWIREELEKRRAQEDQLLQQILREQQMLQELDEDMDQNMAHAKEGRRYREDMKARVDDRVYEMHDLSADKREGMREYGYAYRRGYALAMVFFSLALCVFAGYLHGIASQTCLVLMFFTGVQAAILVHKKQCPKFWKFVCDVFSALIFPGMLILFIGCELHYSYYERALPYCLAVGLFLLALTTASYFLYDPYRSARRRVGDAKSMIRSIERSAKKQVKKNQKQQAKEELIKFMEDKGYGEIKDFGSEDPIYANTAVAVAEAVASGEYDRGILICGTGLGVSIAANKVKGAYAALLSDIYSAKRARLSNDANIACMGAFTIGNKLREELTDAFLTNEFVPGCSSQPKVDAFREYEAAHQK